VMDGFGGCWEVVVGGNCGLAIGAGVGVWRGGGPLRWLVHVATVQVALVV
jgi:hypothetical protein